jgi:hypothetical protein
MLASFSFSDREKFAELLRTLLQDLELIQEGTTFIRSGNPTV